MFDHDSQENNQPICYIIPGFGFYNGIGIGLAESLLNMFEVFTYIFNRTRR